MTGINIYHTEELADDNFIFKLTRCDKLVLLEIEYDEITEYWDNDVFLTDALLPALRDYLADGAALVCDGADVLSNFTRSQLLGLYELFVTVAALGWFDND